MDTIKTDPNQILIFYNEFNPSHKKTIAKGAATGKVISTLTYGKTPSSYNIWMTIFQSLTEDDKKHFFERSDKRYDQLIANKDFSFEDWRNICLNNTDLIKFPVAICGEKVMLVRVPSEIGQLEDEESTTVR